jgi:hypothetical protein
MEENATGRRRAKQSPRKTKLFKGLRVVPDTGIEPVTF